MQCFPLLLVFPRFLIFSVSRFGFRFVSRFVFCIGFCSTILGSRPTPVPVPVPDSVSISPSSRQRLPLLLALLPRGIALYRRQRLITDSHSARPRQVRSCGSRPCPVTQDAGHDMLMHVSSLAPHNADQFSRVEACAKEQELARKR